MRRALAAAFLSVALSVSCGVAPDVETPAMPPELKAKREADLAAAEATLAANPDDPDALIWVGRRLGYLGRFNDAIAAFTRGIEQHPTDARFLRHRGHRYITQRQFARAIADLTRAVPVMLAQPDAIEPDGQPNARNLPTGTLYFNVYYHLALAHYLARDFAAAAATWAECQKVSRSPDKLVATSYWHYLTLRRLGRDAEARALLTPIRSDLEVIENHSYHRLLLAFAAGNANEAMLEGTTDNDPATLGNGVATFLWLSGEQARAQALWRRVVDTTPRAAFGHIAAETELAASK